MIFPFTAIVDQEEMKLALILNVIDPSIGGVLIMGEKGTAKSTTVRALADLLPEIEVVKGCRFNCSPEGPFCSDCLEKIKNNETLEFEKKKMRVVELPLGVTEDRVVGSLDIEHAIKKGEKRFEPGILAEANRNFLYIDEVNLLEDHIVDLLLDSAAMGVNTVEREGISFVHPARFILVGTMNPEEGELRPQLLDRFGLCVFVNSLKEKSLRVEVLKRKAEFDDDPEGFLKKWEPHQQSLAARIIKAKENLKNVKITEDALSKVVEITSQLNLDGHRADIVMLKAARAHAAYNERKEIIPDDIKKIAPLALKHRLKRLPFEEISTELEKLNEVITRI
ncbi:MULTISPECIES: AAA family ATPase [Thermodesulfobacterium]|jgi:magnesium chelatase subunit I|uniref:Magnesium chelatase n=1 Tax=Thermodesulfobacterium commune DSM 2178 TaxID=289377 RepID=A0A075WWA3_9BACT|nr:MULTISPECIES: AAA family ATPase [Thermodesulfobacterium]KUJ98262.1 MAG: Magnesium-chelatase subunit ChlI [Thermodesulfobacterium sp. 37_54]KUK19718.1 MAG: Magnesium-chelatase subunit ChlI [Thermodesulfobacterium commune]MDI3477423.1 magnesium chelatase subunit [Thermoanaerobacterium sp.]AIH04783.1 magnesium chelatase [Thermodesulfobacterium commune DSM 2178]KUK38017.1 MAG: Magnesium-chelatase subunit ChlI [Thermodesulfobacterium commune]